MMQMIDGKILAERIRAKVKERVAMLPTQPGLAIILVGSDPASHLYVSLKERACEEVGIHFEKYLYHAETSTQDLLVRIAELNARPDIHGILVQLPLPAQEEDTIISAIHPKKDVDGFHPENQWALEMGKSGIVSALALGIMKLIDSVHSPLLGKQACIVGSEIFARPLHVLLTELGVTTKRIEGTDPALADTCKSCDVIIVALGRPGAITKNMIKDGAIIIDVGTTKQDDRIIGDVEADVKEEKTGWISPVPGGVGPMTVAMLLLNVLKAYELQRHS